MRRTDLALGAILSMLGCSSDGDAPAGPGGGTGASAQGGTGGGVAGGAGGSGRLAGGGAGGAGNGPPAGGSGAIEEWLIEACASLADEGCPYVFPLKPYDPNSIISCNPLYVDLVPDMQICELSGVSELLCVAASGAGSGAGCSSLDCPAEPPEISYIFRERPSGEVELVRRDAGPGCNWTVPPLGFTQCQTKPSDPEACLCRCEL